MDKDYDRNRTVQLEDEAEAVAKVRDGKITKIIVTRSGRGYVDPYVVIWDSALQKPTGLRHSGSVRTCARILTALSSRVVT